MAGAAPDADEDKPLDPAAERVRRKLVRFMAINLGILFAAVMAVMAAVVYKSMQAPEVPAPMAGEVASAEIVLPRGARVISQSLSGDRLSLHVAVDNLETIVVFDTALRRIVGSYALRKD